MVACLRLILREYFVVEGILMVDRAVLEKMCSERKKYNGLFKLKTYSGAVENFCADYKYIFEEMNSAIEAETDAVAQKIDLVASEFVSELVDIVKKKGRQPGNREMLDTNLYMIMYVFPCILETHGRYSKELTEKVVEKWNASFKNTNLQYADYETINSGFKRKPCYITTAVCDSMGYDDDCRELTVLREFRDGYMSVTVDGPAMIREYYETAPAIVEGINTRTDSACIYREIYKQYIAPCVSMIEAGELEQCLEHYKKMVHEWGAKIIC